MSSANERMIDEQKSSAEILDGLFRELEEKSAKGELPTQSDLSTVLGNTITNSDLHRSRSHRKRKSSKHKHSHRHKRRKKHRKASRSSSDNSSDEWVPAEEQKFSVQVSQITDRCNIQQSCKPSQDKVADNNVMVDNNPECKAVTNPYMTLKPDVMPLPKDVQNHDISNCVEDSIIIAMDKSQQAPKSLLINNEQVIFLPRVTCLDRRVYQRKSLTDQQDLVSAVKDAINEGSPCVVDCNLSNTVPIDSVEIKDCDSSSSTELRQEKTSGKDENMVKSDPVAQEHGLTHKQVAKLKSKISCSTVKQISKKHTAKPKTKLNKTTCTEENELSVGQKLQRKAHDKKRKLKKHSKSKISSSRSRIRSKSTSPRKSCSFSRSTSRRSHSKSPKFQHSESRSGHFKSTIKRKSRSSSRDKKQENPSLSRRLRTGDREKNLTTILGETIDKAKLLEIARKNAIAMMAEGRLPVPATLNLKKPIQEKVMPIPFKASGKSVEELTDFCKLLAKKEKEEGEVSTDDTTNKPYHSSDEEDKGVPFVHHHPFKLKEQPNIIMNIRNAVQIPIKTPAEKAAEGSKLRIQFPVSSGTQHRKKEWVPVSPKKTPEVVKEKAVVTKVEDVVKVEDVTVFQSPPAENAVDIGAIVSQRLKAVRKLMDNPNDIDALNQMYKSQQEMQNWAQSKQLPGQFTGTTDVQILTPEQLAGPAHLQAWVKKACMVLACITAAGLP